MPREVVEIKGNLGGGFTPANSIGVTVWTDESLIQAISDAVATSLQNLGLIGFGAKACGGDRSGGWMRAYLEDATEEESAIFAEAMQEILGPLDNPRYVIPREVKIISATWLSTLLPEVLAK